VVVTALREFLVPPTQALLRNRPFNKTWSSTGGWH
jgi:hypothetical protein